MKKLLALAAVSTMLFSADVTTSTGAKDVESVGDVDTFIPNDPIIKKSPVIVLRSVGEGVAPINVISPAQGKVLAKRAAIADAYRGLSEKMYGIKISAKETVRDLVTTDSEIRTRVYGMIRGAQVEKTHFKDGLYTVVLEVKINTERWQKYLGR